VQYNKCKYYEKSYILNIKTLHIPVSAFFVSVEVVLLVQDEPAWLFRLNTFVCNDMFYEKGSLGSSTLT